tara:strand:+ start:354 stop:596 length:243 start_codon:yes stop_codon:yes gene_type:complete
MPTPIRASQHRNLIAQLQRDNRKCYRKVFALLEIVDGLTRSLNDVIDTIALHEHNDNALKLLEADLGELLNVTNEQLINL